MSGIPHVKCELCKRMVPVLKANTIAGNSCAFVWTSERLRVANICRQCLQIATSDYAAQYNDAVKEAREA